MSKKRTSATGRHFIRWADHTDSDELNLTPLHQAAYEGSSRKVQELINAGADVNKPDARGLTPLHDAALRDHIKIVKLLIAAGANVNAQDTDDQFTPLHDAAISDSTRIMKLLVAAGADTTLKDRDGLTADAIVARRKLKVSSWRKIGNLLELVNQHKAENPE